MISAKIRTQVLKLLAAGCLFGIAFPRVVVAEVSDDDFNKLKAMVEQLNEKVQRLEQTHEEDQQKIRELEESTDFYPKLLSGLTIYDLEACGTGVSPTSGTRGVDHGQDGHATN
jgi:tetrahydromethanopterin S-methyltransferase subunit G